MIVAIVGKEELCDVNVDNDGNTCWMLTQAPLIGCFVLLETIVIFPSHVPGSSTVIFGTAIDMLIKHFVHSSLTHVA